MLSLLETLINGLLLGALYALFGIGLSLSLGVMRMINIAHGDLIVLGAYLSSVIVLNTDLDPLSSLLIVIPMMFVIGWLLQKLLFNRVMGRDPLSPLLLTFGLSIVIQNLLQELFSADTRSLPAGDLALQGIELGGVNIGVLPLISAGISVLAFLFVAHLINRSPIGSAVRAVADDQETARLVGVNDRRLFAYMAGFVLVTVAVASVLYGMRTPFSPTAGPERLIYSFEAVVLGGLGNLWGTFFGGLIIGVAQLLGARIDTGLGPFFGHLVFLVVLIARPEGLFKAGRA
ncbi:branched-chain amino acid ABC transporter permease [Marinobacterium sedimentorum]|uniref:branched-chain amino acid ABC transporter permease n=1 Tax=Marinobacterium sedimentorum TaxID=2927804 RepID=UPI0020C66E4D|nr:branched-chain amino acid ABC transporter permease [Marinobacterium sedimentorum]MCP8688715.1 branched-chain amino acid ABC transporter permease [Marinobacterium sedimentorum]